MRHASFMDGAHGWRISKRARDRMKATGDNRQGNMFQAVYDDSICRCRGTCTANLCGFRYVSLLFLCRLYSLLYCSRMQEVRFVCLDEWRTRYVFWLVLLPFFLCICLSLVRCDLAFLCHLLCWEDDIAYNRQYYVPTTYSARNDHSQSALNQGS